MVERQRFLESRVFGRTQVLTGTMRTLPVRVGGVVGAHHTQFVCGGEQSRNVCVTPSDHRVTGHQDRPACFRLRSGGHSILPPLHSTPGRPAMASPAARGADVAPPGATVSSEPADVRMRHVRDAVATLERALGPAGGAYRTARWQSGSRARRRRAGRLQSSLPA